MRQVHNEQDDVLVEGDESCEVTYTYLQDKNLCFVYITQANPSYL